MEGILSGALTGFDVVLALTLIGLAAVLLTTPDLFEAIVLFIVFGILMAIVWGRLDAVDLALAEAAIGAGLTGALLLNARGDLVARQERARAGGRTESQPEQRGRPARLVAALLVAPIAAIIAWAVAAAPRDLTGMRDPTLAALGESGVESPVTAVLLNLRAYDTLLEVAVLLLAVVGAWSQRLSSARLEIPPPGPVLLAATRVLVPVAVLTGGYLLWRGTHAPGGAFQAGAGRGTHAPGGAFQAGAVLAGAGVLVLLAERSLPARWSGGPLRLGLAAGVLVFVVAGLPGMVAGEPFLHYRGERASDLIVAVEVAATVTIALSLIALFAGRPPPAPEEAS